MLQMQRILNQFRRYIAIVLLTTLVWIISLPTTSVQADGYFSEKSHRVEKTKPYYSTREGRIAENSSSRPYYASKERHREKATVTQPQTGNDINSGKRAKDAIPRDLDGRSR